MQYRGMVVGVGLLLLAWPMLAGIEDSTSAPTAVTYNVSAGQGTAGSILRIENRTTKLHMVERPSEEHPLEIRNVGQHAVVKFRGVRLPASQLAAASRPIPLKPNCVLEMALGELEIRDSMQPAKATTLVGSYIGSPGSEAVTPSQPSADTVEIVVKQPYEPMNPKVPADAAFPLSITLRPTSPSYRLSEPMNFEFGLRNNSAIPIMIENFFNYPYYQNFKIRKTLGGRELPANRWPLAWIEHHALYDWLVLLPGDTLWYTADISNEFDTPGVYMISASYTSGPVVVYPAEGKPYYSSPSQRRWSSPEIQVTVAAQEPAAQ